MSRITSGKKEKYRSLKVKFQKIKYCKIREFAKLLGTLISACPAVPYGIAHTKMMERERYLALIKSNDNYESCMRISESIYPDLKWWYFNIMHCKKHFGPRKISLQIFTDASLTGWGAHCNGECWGSMVTV